MVRAPIEAGNTWLAEHGGVPVGTITLQWVDEPMWGARPPDAGYVHRLAIRRSVAGLGAELLASADAHVAAHGRAFLRLDCWSGNAALRRYYEHAGFTHRGERSEESWTVSRYDAPCDPRAEGLGSTAGEQAQATR